MTADGCGVKLTFARFRRSCSSSCSSQLYLATSCSPSIETSPIASQAVGAYTCVGVATNIRWSRGVLYNQQGRPPSKVGAPRKWGAGT
jgi:hypothetical protein